MNIKVHTGTHPAIFSAPSSFTVTCMLAFGFPVRGPSSLSSILCVYPYLVREVVKSWMVMRRPVHFTVTLWHRNCRDNKFEENQSCCLSIISLCFLPFFPPLSCVSLSLSLPPPVSLCSAFHPQAPALTPYPNHRSEC